MQPSTMQAWFSLSETAYSPLWTRVEMREVAQYMTRKLPMNVIALPSGSRM